MRSSCFAELPGNTRFILVSGLVIVILTAGVLSYIYHERIQRPIYCARTGTGPFEAPGELNRFVVALQPDGILWDPSGQRLAHRVVLGGIAAVCLVELVCYGTLSRRWIERMTRCASCLLLLSLSLLPAFLAALAGAGADGLTVSLGLTSVYVAYLYGPRMRRPGWQLPSAVLSVLLIAAAWGPALAMRFDLSGFDWGDIEHFMAHWVVVVGPTDRLLHGAPLYEAARPFYGGLTTLLAVGLQRVWGEFSLRDYCVFIAGLQAVGLVLALYVYYRLTGRRWALCLLPLILAGCNHHFSEFWYHYPNHTAWRHIAFPAALSVYVLLRRTGIQGCAFGLGCSSLLALIHNVETGVAITAGNLTYLIFRECAQVTGPSLRTITMRAMTWIFGGSVGFAGWMLCSRLVLGNFPDLVSMGEAFAVPFRFTSSGLGSLWLGQFQPLALVILAHATFALIYSWLDRPRRKRWSTALRSSVAATILVWFAYYFYRPRPEYLLGYHLLYGCLLADLLRLLALSRSPRIPSLPKGVAFFIVGMVVVPIVVTQCFEQWPSYCAGLTRIMKPPSKSNATLIAGVTVPAGTRADMLKRKAEFLRGRAADGPVVYLTEDSYLIPKASGVWPALSIACIFYESKTRQRYEAALRGIRTALVTEIYVDEKSTVGMPGGVPESRWPPYPRYSQEFFRYLRHDLGTDFQLVGIREGWEVWQRKPCLPSSDPGILREPSRQKRGKWRSLFKFSAL